MSDDIKECPMCAETIKAKAIVCRFCGTKLNASALSGRIASANPDVPPIPWQKIAIIVAAFVMAPFLLDILTSFNQTEDTTVLDDLPIAVTVEELVLEFEQNEVAALNRFADRSIEVTAEIASINAGSGDRPFVNLGWNDTLLPVQASFAPDQIGFVGGLKKGDEITLICTSINEVLGTPMLSGCRQSQYGAS